MTVRQIRLFFTAPKPQAEAVFAKAEAEFAEEGWPLAAADNDAQHNAEISLYAAAGQEKQALARLAAAAGVNPAAIKTEILPEIDWVKHSLAGLKPVRAGRFFVHGAHDRGKIRPEEIGIEIEANRAFGTGHHGTTAGCLEMLEKLLGQTPQRHLAILDIGTGSGILAIAAAKLGQTNILATDNDPQAIAIAAENIALNGARTAVTTLCAEGFAAAEIAAKAPFDLIIANILAAPLTAMAAEMKRALRPGGALLLSGILAEQRQAVLATYCAQGLRHIETLPKEGWVTLYLREGESDVSEF